MHENFNEEEFNKAYKHYQEVINQFNNHKSSLERLIHLSSLINILDQTFTDAFSQGKPYLENYDRLIVAGFRKQFKFFIYETIDNSKSEINNMNIDEISEAKFQIEGLVDLFEAQKEKLIVEGDYFVNLLKIIENGVQTLAKQIQTKSETHDDRIDGNLSKEEVKAYFMKLNQPQYDGQPVLSVNQIDTLLHANFQGFENRCDIEKFDTPNFNGLQLMRFVHEFYDMHCLIARTGEYIHFLKNNFSRFDNSSFDTVRSNFSK